MTLLPFQRAHEISVRASEQKWLIEDLWAEQAVGIVGGEPKVGKSFLALDVAVAVASGTPCLRHFTVRRTGTVLLYAAEDALAVVRERLDGICAAAQTQLHQIPIQVITAPRLRLDTSEDRVSLWETVEALRPTLLILDPFIRMHSIDENHSFEVSPLLADLRQLQRRFEVAVLVVHHAKKNAGRQRPGQALRGSSEFHGWGDSNLYLRHTHDQLLLNIEHRAAPSHSDIPLQLEHQDAALALAVLDAEEQSATTQAAERHTPQQRVLDALHTLTDPVPLLHLRQLCRMRTATLCETLVDLERRGQVERAENGYQTVRTKS